MFRTKMELLFLYIGIVFIDIPASDFASLAPQGVKMTEKIKKTMRLTYNINKKYAFVHVVKTKAYLKNFIYVHFLLFRA